MVVHMVFDYLRPWCYLAEVRLERARAPFGEAVRVRRNPYVLKLEKNPNASFSYDRRGHWAIAARAEPGLVLNLWTGGQRYPVFSPHALIAARAAPGACLRWGGRPGASPFPPIAGCSPFDLAAAYERLSPAAQRQMPMETFRERFRRRPPAFTNGVRGDDNRVTFRFLTQNQETYVFYTLIPMGGTWRISAVRERPTSSPWPD